MDQLKTQLAVVLKFGFWIGSVIVLFGSVYAWYSATTTLAAETESQTSKVESAFRQVTDVRSAVPTTPNDLSHKEMNTLITARTAEVLTSWRLLYNRQKKLLTWPVEELRQDFVDEYIDLTPIEIYVNFPTKEEDELVSTLLSRYGNYIKNTLPGIAKIGNTKWTAEFEAQATGQRGQAQPVASIDITGEQGGPLVEWSDASQAQVLADLFPWRGRRPNTLEVYYSQENIWILKQLLQIVSDVNGDASQPYQAKIHEIRKIGIGNSVQFGAGQISKPGVTSMGMSGEMGMGGEMDMGSEMGGGGGMGDMMSEGGDPADNRYVDVKMVPIKGAALRSALASNSPADASLAVAKRVPVMMGLNIDQRAVHELIATCGSSDLMVEVQQVRVLPPNKKLSADSGGMGGGGATMGLGMGGGGMGMGMGGEMGGGARRTTAPQQEFPLDVYVEIYGIIYIYNPPDPEKFGLDKVTADTVIAGATTTIGGAPIAPEPDEGELPVPQPDAPTDGGTDGDAGTDPDPAPPSDSAPTDPEAVAPTDATAPAPAAPPG